MTTNESRAQQLAEAFRAMHGLGVGPVKDMYELLHVAKGIDVISMSVPETEHGLSMCDPDSGRVVIAVATTPHPMRQRSSIAHELGHVLGGDLEQAEPLTPGDRSPAEIRADAFARHLLLPLDAIHRRFGAGRAAASVSLADLSDLVQEFEVSASIAAIQLRTLKLVDTDTCTAWSARSVANLATTFGWGSQYRALAADSSLPRAPQALMARAVEGYHRGILGINELAGWYGRDPSELEAELGAPPPTTEIDDWDDDAPLFPDGERGYIHS
ncbi:ImmA/IrrE family metallo-endopeptidase [Actinoplanes sp. CA-054009]